MTKLILSDIDGTLLHGKETEIDPAYFDEIRRLHDKGIVFAPATGRQDFGVRILFRPVSDLVYSVPENGACVFSPENNGTLIFSNLLKREDAFAICKDVFEDSRCQLMLCSPTICYLVAKNERFEEHVVNYDCKNYTMLDDYRNVPEEICKISVYCEDGLPATHAVEDKIAPKYRDRFEIAIAGDRWLDFTVDNKGSGAKVLCEHLGITRDEVIAFGDNYNDISMLEFAGTSYIMENAEQPLKDMFPNHCRNVLDVLRTL